MTGDKPGIVQIPACVGKLRVLYQLGLRIGFAHLLDHQFRATTRVEAGFVSQWQAVAGKNNVIKRLTQAMQAAEAIYLATDPDREGEAIAAHILALTKIPQDVPVMHMSFTAITKEAVRHAVENPRPLDMALVAAQHARRKLDRLVGYLVSPIACRVLDGRYSAGRLHPPCGW